jgi:hypothetical protein
MERLMHYHILFVLILLSFFAEPWNAQGQNDESTEITITHGPILGRLSHDGIGVWVRTSKPSEFLVMCTDGANNHVSATDDTSLAHDNTGWVLVTGLTSNTDYHYEVKIPGSPGRMMGGQFKTLAHESKFHHK